MLELLLYTFFIGFLPGVFWLLFWMHEDNRDLPEPKWLIIKVFFLSWIGAFIVFLVQWNTNILFKGNQEIIDFLSVASEEVIKFLIVYFIALRTKYNNEITDPLLYMIIGAIGFSTLENILFLIKTYHQYHDIIYSTINIFYRYIGATMIHVGASAFLGLSLSLTYFKRKKIRLIGFHIGLFLAIGVHYLFNYFIGQNDVVYKNLAFYFGWILIFFILVIFEWLRYKNKKFLKLKNKIKEKEIKSKENKIVK